MKQFLLPLHFPLWYICWGKWVICPVDISHQILLVTFSMLLYPSISCELAIRARNLIRFRCNFLNWKYLVRVFAVDSSQEDVLSSFFLEMLRLISDFMVSPDSSITKLPINLSPNDLCSHLWLLLRVIISLGSQNGFFLILTFLLYQHQLFYKLSVNTIGVPWNRIQAEKTGWMVDSFPLSEFRKWVGVPCSF